MNNTYSNIPRCCCIHNAFVVTFYNHHDNIISLHFRLHNKRMESVYCSKHYPSAVGSDNAHTHTQKKRGTYIRCMSSLYIYSLLEGGGWGGVFTNLIASFAMLHNMPTSSGILVVVVVVYPTKKSCQTTYPVFFCSHVPLIFFHNLIQWYHPSIHYIHAFSISCFFPNAFSILPDTSGTSSNSSSSPSIL